MPQLIAQGLSNQEIGERLFLALDTVKGHNRRIFDKLPYMVALFLIHVMGQAMCSNLGTHDDGD